MKEKLRSNLQLSQLCRSLALLIHAGVWLGEGLTMLAEENSGEAPLYRQMSRRADEGAGLPEILEETGVFPRYVTALVSVGERTGRTEEALMALSRWYQEQDELERQIKSSLTYPCILLLLMVVVIVTLLTQVLPIFEEVYQSLGGQLTGAAAFLTGLGRWMTELLPLLCLLAAAVVAPVLAFLLHPPTRDRMLTLWQKHMGDQGISRKLNEARFAQGLSMGLNSGLALEEGVSLAGELLKDIPAAAKRCERCIQKLNEGEDLALALKESQMLPPSACRLLQLGLRAGQGDGVMEEISGQLTQEARHALARRTAQVEPTLVLFTSVLVGGILLSVMLPLMHIMSAIG